MTDKQSLIQADLDQEISIRGARPVVLAVKSKLQTQIYSSMKLMMACKHRLVFSA